MGPIAVATEENGLMVARTRAEGPDVEITAQVEPSEGRVVMDRRL